MKAIYFDMDGTIADLYNVKNWESRLRTGDVYPYLVAKPMVNMSELDALLNEFANLGIIIGVISWGAKQATAEYTREVKKVKQMWLDKYLTCITEVHVVKYGTPKHATAKIKNSILIDDNERVRNAWKNGATIDASNSEEMMEELRALLDMLKAA